MDGTHVGGIASSHEMGGAGGSSAVRPVPRRAEETGGGTRLVRRSFVQGQPARHGARKGAKGGGGAGQVTRQSTKSTGDQKPGVAGKQGRCNRGRQARRTVGFDLGRRGRMRRAAEVGRGAKGPELKVRSLAAGGAAQCVFFGVDFSGVFSSETRSGIGGQWPAAAFRGTPAGTATA